MAAIKFWNKVYSLNFKITLHGNVKVLVGEKPKLTSFMVTFIFVTTIIWRQYGPVVKALALKSGDRGFKADSDHSLHLIMVAPGSTSRLHP